MWSRGIIAVEALVVQLRAVRHHDAKRPTSRVEQIQCRWEGLESGDALVRSWLRMESWRGYGLCGCAERGGVLALLIVFLFQGRGGDGGCAELERCDSGDGVRLRVAVRPPRKKSSGSWFFLDDGLGTVGGA